MSTATSEVRDRTIEVRRSMGVPRQFVFEAWTEVRHLSEWFGPNGFTTTTRRHEFRVGGVWEFTMHGPNGTDYPNYVEWREIDPPARILFLHGAHEGDPRTFESEVTFVEEGESTIVTIRSVFPTVEQRNEVVEHYGAIEGGHQTLARLDAFANSMRNRTSDA